ncbi:MAG: 16S rRNA (guanine(527)-N(7))-methyltransferase RsmG [Acidimicrobiia bacterium]
MKHQAGLEVVRRAAGWAGVDISTEQEARLVRYADWLEEEAIPAGGLGPREAGRIWSRHLADSVTMAVAWRGSVPPSELLDVGSGAGLPGIPLAIVWPATWITLLDRGGRRIRLLRRGARILGLPNTLIEQGDVFSVADEWEAVAFRGAVTPPEAVGLSARLLPVGGTAVVALSRRAEPPARAEELAGMAHMLGLRAEVVEVPQEVLDGHAWILIIRFRGD